MIKVSENALILQEMDTSLHATEVAEGKRFEFGKNWARFLSVLNDQRIAQAEASLCEMLELKNLAGRRFIDIGSGSGLFSLAARRLGATVYSLDYDPDSVACTTELRRRYFPEDPQWTVAQGSALDTAYIQSLGQFEVVYSWGVLHHTGNMWKGLENAQSIVADGGKLFVAIYNDTGSQSRRWKTIKRIYNKIPGIFRSAYAAIVIAPSEMKTATSALVRLKPGDYVKSWTNYDKNRGMTKWRDIIDWVGGYPYEVAKPEEIFEYFRARGFNLTKLKCGGVGLGCCEFVFEKFDSGE